MCITLADNLTLSLHIVMSTTRRWSGIGFLVVIAGSVVSPGAVAP